MSTLLSQRRARYALDRVQQVRNREQSVQEDYSRWCKRLPAMVLGSGLGQAMAFLRADAKDDKKKATYQLYADLSTWLTAERKIYTETDLIEGLCRGSRTQYVHAQRESLELLGWLKRFATAYLAEPSEQPAGQS